MSIKSNQQHVTLENIEGVDPNSLIYFDSDGIGQELALGAAGALLVSTGTSSAPDFTRDVSIDSLNTTGDVVIGGSLTVLAGSTVITSTVVDIADRVVHYNDSTGANDPVPAAITGFSIHRGAISSVDRDHYGLFWDESASLWKFAVNTGGDDATLGAYLSVRMLDLTAAAATFSSVTNSGLTTGHIVIAGASGLLTEDASFGYAFNVSSDYKVHLSASAPNHNVALELTNSSSSGDAYSAVINDASKYIETLVYGSAFAGTIAGGLAKANNSFLASSSPALILMTYTGSTRPIYVCPQEITVGTWTTTGLEVTGTLSASSLTNTRVVVAGASGVLSGNAGFIYVAPTLTINYNAVAVASLPAVMAGGDVLLRVSGIDTDPTRVLIDSYCTATSGAACRYSGRHARGTAASPTATQNGDFLVNLSAFGRGATVYSASPIAYVQFGAIENFTDAAQGTSFELYLTPVTTIATAKVLTVTNAAMTLAATAVLTASSVLDATSGSAAAISTLGGVGMAKALWVGTTGTFGGVVLGPVGSESNPSYSFSTDADTGVFHPATNTLGIAVGALERYRFTSSGSFVASRNATTIASLDTPTFTNDCFAGHSADATDLISSLNSYAGNTIFIGRVIGGTGATPSATQSGQSFTVALRGWATAFGSTNRASIAMSTVENWSGTATGTQMVFSVNKATTLTVGTALTLAYGASDAAPTATFTGAIAAASLTLTTALAVAQGGTGSTTAATARAALGCAIDQYNLMIEAPTAKTYTLIYSSKIAFTINEVTALTASGTCTVAIKINGTNVTSLSALAVTSTPATTAASGANTVALTDIITVVVTAPSSCVDLVLNLKVTI